MAITDNNGSLEGFVGYQYLSYAYCREKKGYLKISGSLSLRRIYSFQAIASILCPSKSRTKQP